MTELLQVDHLSKQYPGFTLQDISFSVKPGRIMGLIGKNGAGKSTTLKSILNMVRPESGTVTVLERIFTRMKRNVSRTSALCLEGLTFTRLKSSPPLPLLPGGFIKTGIRNGIMIISASFLWMRTSSSGLFPTE